MKTKFFFFAALFLALASGLFATVLTVSNNPSSPGEYTSLQAAIDAAGIGGDTIMVSGSPNSYGNITIYKQLVIVGAGYNNPYGYGSTINDIYCTRANEYVSSSGTRLMGFFINNLAIGAPIEMNWTLSNILVERCSINILRFFNEFYSEWMTYNNDTIRNCIINAYLQFQSRGTYNNIIVHDNIFNGSYILSSSNNSLSTVFVRNNIFINRAAQVFNSVSNMVIENNIFYGSYPTGGSGCAFTKNIGYLCPEMPGDGNVGSGNLNNTNPQFVNFPLLGGGFDWSYDFHLQPTSPGKNAGTDGTDIGIYGGMLPFDVGANPHFPQMMTLTLPSGSSVPAGGTLNVHFTAKKQN